MQEEKVYRQEGFGLSALVAALEVPEYRLRRLIHQRLGHRNFSSFVNGYRLAEVTAALADPEPDGRRHPDHRPRCRLPVHRPVQPCVQGAYRHDADGLSQTAEIPHRRADFRNRPGHHGKRQDLTDAATHVALAIASGRPKNVWRIE